jgi:hypothetical protein
MGICTGLARVGKTSPFPHDRECMQSNFTFPPLPLYRFTVGSQPKDLFQLEVWLEIPVSGISTT